MKKNILLLLIVSLVLQIGCVDEKKGISKNGKNSSLQVEGVDSEILERSEKISDIVVELFGIDGATTLIFNDTAIVSVIISYDQKLNDDTRETIVNVVKENDNLIKNVKIAEDEKTFNEIENIIGELLNGKPYDDYVLEINKILDRNLK
ncbi:YhcN/YlaJ family sporulation lipoprotein [Tissierella creatinophila]|uniref:Sporulation lipoprotein YhcN/YlaJ n=1 Tax=Tissierella creatinophila DSM 6911 TaxID=1123403 RepID=A0A1U7M3Y1_TISCR|nr:YhcN/YlaJ family sporulation lipoprotein [Tissierella creatinophila]OLS02024.1 sporulation lipoprotein YhcN/YlaJ [Tissierella creatinophila DSM 6911]